MTTAEWALWITNTLFQGVLAYFMVWENYKMVRIREKQIELIQMAKSQKKVEVVE